MRYLFLPVVYPITRQRLPELCAFHFRRWTLKKRTMAVRLIKCNCTPDQILRHRRWVSFVAVTRQANLWCPGLTKWWWSFTVTLKSTRKAFACATRQVSMIKHSDRYSFKLIIVSIRKLHKFCFKIYRDILKINFPLLLQENSHQFRSKDLL